MTDFPLFLHALAKALLLTGIGPGIAVAGIVRVGVRCNVQGSEVGEFVGKCIDTLRIGGMWFMRFRVEKVLLAQPHFTRRGKCPYPDCILADCHGGDHSFPRMGRIEEGGVVELTPYEARCKPIQSEVA